jgi:hypothetical protein
MFKDERNIMNYIVMLCFLSNILVSGLELVIGEERIEPGSIYDFYTVTFNIIQPTKIDLALHKDWSDKYGYELMQPFSTTYKDVYFAEICKATRN